jgi:hypothetical protein
MTCLEARLQFLCCALIFLGVWSHFVCRPDSLDEDKIVDSVTY